MAQVRPGSASRERELPPWLWIVLMVLAGFWVYLPALAGTWIWDDDYYFLGNPLRSDPAGVWKIWFQLGSIVNYFPITATVQWVQWNLWHSNTSGCHITNVLLHVLSGVLIWRLLQKLGLRLGWLGGLLFVIDPMNVESVAWIAELKNTLCLPPFLLAMCALIDFEANGRARDYLRALGWFLFAMLCKISMMTFPGVMVLYVWWKRGRITWRDVAQTLPFVVISVGLVLTTQYAGALFIKLNHEPADVIPTGGFLWRCACAELALGDYLLHTVCPFWPVPIYPHWAVRPFSAEVISGWLGLLILGLLLWLRRKSTAARHILLGLGFYIIMILPFLGFTPLAYMTFTWVMDHFLYLPLIGAIGLFVAGVEWLQVRLPSAMQLGLRAGLFALIVVLAWTSHTYAGVFTDNRTLWAYTVQQNPSAYVAQNNLANEMLILTPADALSHLDTALLLEPDFLEARYNRAIALEELHRLPEALAEFQRAVRLAPGDIDSHEAYGAALLKADQVAEALDQLGAAVRLDPTSAPHRCNLAMALLKAGRTKDALDEYRRAVAADPDFPFAHEGLGNALMKTGQVLEAAGEFQEAIRLESDYAVFHSDLGLALVQLNRPADAIPEFQKALRDDPQNVTARENLQRLPMSPQAPVPEATK